MIIRLSAVPPEHALVVLTFQVEKKQILLRGELTSRVIHTIKESVEEGEVGSIGIQFQDSIEQVRSQLVPLLPAGRQ